MTLREFVRAHRRLDQARRLVRFLGLVPPRDYLRPRLVAAALRARRNTYLDYPRLAALYDAARRAPAGAFVECGVWNGGSAAMLAAGGGGARPLWLFDSWQGLPEPAEVDVAFAGHRRQKGDNLGSRAEVERLLLGRFGLDPACVHVVQGWFEDTIPAAATGPIALLHVDGDWYASVRVCLETLWDRVVPGGVAIVDDYLHWAGCKQAVDEFARERGLRVELGPAPTAVLRR